MSKSFSAWINKTGQATFGRMEIVENLWKRTESRASGMRI